MKQPKNSLQLPKPTRNTRKIANKLTTVASDEITLQSKHHLISHVAKMKAAASAHPVVDVTPFLAYLRARLHEKRMILPWNYRCGYTGHFLTWEIALLARETAFSSVTDVSRGKFPMDTSKRSHEAPMTLNVVSWKGVPMPEVKEPIRMLRLIATRKRKVSSQFSFAPNDKQVRAGTPE